MDRERPGRRVIIDHAKRDTVTNPPTHLNDASDARQRRARRL